MAKQHINDPVSHCRRGQGGRTFSLSKPGGKKFAPPGTAPNEAHKRGLRQKIQPQPTGNARYPHGKYYDWDNDPDGLNKKLGLARLDKKKA